MTSTQTPAQDTTTLAPYLRTVLAIVTSRARERRATSASDAVWCGDITAPRRAAAARTLAELAALGHIVTVGTDEFRYMPAPTWDAAYPLARCTWCGAGDHTASVCAN